MAFQWLMPEKAEPIINTCIWIKIYTCSFHPTEDSKLFSVCQTADGGTSVHCKSPSVVVLLFHWERLVGVLRYNVSVGHCVAGWNPQSLYGEWKIWLGLC